MSVPIEMELGLARLVSRVSLENFCGNFRLVQCFSLLGGFLHGGSTRSVHQLAFSSGTRLKKVCTNLKSQRWPSPANRTNSDFIFWRQISRRVPRRRGKIFFDLGSSSFARTRWLFICNLSPLGPTRGVLRGIN